MRFTLVLLPLCAALAAESAVAQRPAARYRVDAWTSNDGLPSSFISDFTQTRDGFLWLAAGGDLVRFDGVSFRIFNNTTDSALSDRVNYVWAGPGDTLWLWLDDLAVVSLHDGRFSRHGTDRMPGWVAAARSHIRDRARGELLSVRRSGALGQIVDTTGVVYASYRWSPAVTPRLIDRHGRLWASTSDEALVFAPNRPDAPLRIPLGARYSLGAAIEDREGNIWLAGVGLLRIQEVAFQTISRPAGREGIETQVEQLTPGPHGSILARYVQRPPALYRIDETGLALLRTGTLHAAADRRGTIWLSDDRESQPITGLREQGPAITIPHRGSLVLADDPVRAGSAWFSSSGWLYRAEPYAAGGPRVADSLPLPGFPQIAAVGPDGALWVATVDTLRHYRLTRVLGEQRTTWTSGDGLPRGAIRAILPDSDGTVWLGTYGSGLVRLRSGRFEAVLERDGLAENVVSGLLLDRAGNFWMGGNRGVHRVERQEARDLLEGRAGRVHGIAYGRRDGLNDPETSSGAAARSADGRFWFPTFGGAAVVDPVRALALDSTAPLVHVLDLGTPGDTVPARDGMRLRRGQRRMAIAFAGISLRDPAGVRYQYRLDGVDDNWIDPGTVRVAVYNSVGPGRHTFRVRAMNKGGVWSRDEATLSFTVPAYFHETIAFYLLLATSVIAAAWLLFRYRTVQLRRRQQELTAQVDERTRELGQVLVKLEAQADQLRSLDEAKSRFFANVSHEFRTPLTLVLGPLEDVRDGRCGPLPGPAKQRLDTVLANGRRLVQLVEQLLDVARIESGTMQLNAEVHDLVPLLNRISESFASMAERRGLGFRVACPADGIRVRFDPDQIEKVITNLLGNALKFTPAGESVALRAGAVSEADGSSWAVVEVEDTGPGIAAEHLPRVFDRFYQVDDSPRRAHGGAGIGLALARELVELHGGRLGVRSAPGEGSTFTVRLPLDGSEGKNGDGTVESEPPAATGSTGTAAVAAESAEAAGEDRTTVLVAEDNAELLAYLREHLAERYRVLEAANGRVALDLVRRHVPDLVISDVMMPELDGQALCAIIKGDSEIDFIPVILLTAKASRESRLAGLEGGADDYLAKPVDIRELLVRSANLIDSRRRLRERYREANRELPRVALPLKPGKWDNRDEALLKHIYQVLAEHVGDESFQVEALAAAVGLGRSTLYRRMEELLGRSPMDVMWDYRIEQAGQWLLETDANVSEIAYGVGFKSVPHFCGKFRERYGRSPTAYRKSPAGSAS